MLKASCYGKDMKRYIRYILFIWKSRIGKSDLHGLKVDQWLSGSWGEVERLTTKELRKLFRVIEMVYIFIWLLFGSLYLPKIH